MGEERARILRVARHEDLVVEDGHAHGVAAAAAAVSVGVLILFDFSPVPSLLALALVITWPVPEDSSLGEW